MRILVGMPDKASLGGPIYCEPLFVEGLRKAGVLVDEETYVYGDGKRPTPIWRRILRVLDAALRLRRRAWQNHYDVIHLNTSIDRKCVLRDLTTIMFLRFSGVPVYLKMHGSDASFLAGSGRFWRGLTKRLFDSVAAIGVLSNEEEENFQRGGCPREKLFPAKYVVDADEFRVDPAFNQRLGVAVGTAILLFSARFIPAKGLLTVIEACAEIKKSGREFKLICLGDGPMRGEAEKLVDKLGLREHTVFTGYIPEAETAAYHANATIFIFPTYHDEGFPLVLLKSIAAGLPIITTPLRGAADHMKDPDNCLWIKPRDPGDLANKILKLLDDAALRTKMRENNRRLRERFAVDEVVDEYVNFYQKIACKGS